MKTKEEKRERNRLYCAKYRIIHKERLQRLNRDWKRKNKEQAKELNKRERNKLKLEVLKKYSLNGKAECVCGYSDVRALTIDHIYNNGAEQREELFGRRTYAGTTFYRWLRKNNFPDGYQTLCFNCNWIKEMECRK